MCLLKKKLHKEQFRGNHLVPSMYYAIYQYLQGDSGWSLPKHVGIRALWYMIDVGKTVEFKKCKETPGSVDE